MGYGKGDTVCLPKISIIPIIIHSNTNEFDMKLLYFAVTIIQSQGETFGKVEFYLIKKNVLLMST